MKKFWVINEHENLFAFPGDSWDDGGIAIDIGGKPKSDCLGTGLKEFGVDIITGEDFELMCDWYTDGGVIVDYENFRDVMINEVKCSEGVIYELLLNAMKFDRYSPDVPVDYSLPTKEYEIETDAYAAIYLAVNVDEAVRQHALSTGMEWASMGDMIRDLEEIPGAYLKICRDGQQIFYCKPTEARE